MWFQWDVNPSVKRYLRKLRPVNGWNDSAKTSVFHGRCVNNYTIFLRIGSQERLSRYRNYTTSWITEESWFDSRQGQEMFLLSSIQPGCGAHTSSCQWAPNVQRQVYEADHSSTAVVEVKNYWSYTFPPPFALVTCTGTTLPSVWCCILCVPCISIHMPS